MALNVFCLGCETASALNEGTAAGGGVCLVASSWGSALKAKPPYPIRAAPEAMLSQIHVANLLKIRSLTVRTVGDNTFCLAQVALFIYIELFCL